MAIRILHGDCREVLKTLPEGSAHCCVTSPPYWGLRDYGVSEQIGMEATPEEYIRSMVEVFREVRRVLRDDGTLWLNLGDSYANDGKWGGASGGKQEYLDGDERRRARRKTGLPPKSLVGIPWKVAFALQEDGWILRQDIIWAKPNAMPESVVDRPTKSHEYIFLLAKSPKYYYDHEAIKEPAVWDLTGEETAARCDRAKNEHKSAPTPLKNGIRPRARNDKQRGHSKRHAGFNERWDKMPKEEQCSGKRNKRSVWTVGTASYKEAHFATYPPKLIEPCILAGSPSGGMVIDPFFGAGTTGLVADQLGRNVIGVEINPDYVRQSEDRIRADAGLFFQTV